MVATGSVPRSGESPVASAYAQAVLLMAYQVATRVEGDRQVMQECVSSSDARNCLQQFRSTTRAETVVRRLEGAETLAAWEDGPNQVVMVGIHRGRVSVRTRQRMEEATRRQDSLLVQARRAAAAGDFLDAAGLAWSAGTVAADLDEMDAILRVVGRQSSGFTWLGVGPAGDLARSYADRARLAVRVTGPDGVAALASSAIACLGSARVPVVEGAEGAGAVLHIQASTEPASQASEGYFIARARLSMTLRRAREGSTISGGSGETKGHGTLAAAAERDALRRLSSEVLPQLLVRTLAEVRWAIGLCAPE